MKNFNENLRNLMNENKISQNKLAKILKSSQQSVSRYVNGITEPDICNLIQIANYFSVSTDYLLGLSDDQGNIINNALSENENYIIKLFREMPTEHKTELINYANYLTNKNTKPHTPNNGIDISDLTEMQQAEILGFINGFRNNLFAKNSNK